MEGLDDVFLNSPWEKMARNLKINLGSERKARVDDEDIEGGVITDDRTDLALVPEDIELGDIVEVSRNERQGEVEW